MRVHGHGRRCRHSPLFPHCDCGAIEDAEELERLRRREREAADAMDDETLRDIVEAIQFDSVDHGLSPERAAQLVEALMRVVRPGA